MNRQAAIVTGASRGIGRGIVIALAEQGWAVCVNYLGNVQAATEVASLVEEAGGQALVVQANVVEAADRQRLLTETLQAFGRIDLLVNNVGMAPRQRVDMLETSEASYDEVMNVNLRGPFFFSQLVAKAMIAGLEAGTIEHPKIINLGSISTYTSSPPRAEYCISKAGMGMMTNLFADRLAEYGINVYEIRPGVIETDMTSTVKEKYDRLIGEGLTPIKRWGKPDDVARAVIAIAEDYFPFSTGEVINVDGGFHLRRL